MSDAQQITMSVDIPRMGSGMGGAPASGQGMSGLTQPPVVAGTGSECATGIMSAEQLKRESSRTLMEHIEKTNSIPMWTPDRDDGRELGEEYAVFRRELCDNLLKELNMVLNSIALSRNYEILQ